MTLMLAMFIAGICSELSSASAQPVEVAVLPMTSTAKSLRLYRSAAPSALARRLSAKAGVSVVAMTSASDVPKSARVIIDGRLVGKGDGRLQIEVHLRRAATGRSIATLASREAEATDIDQLVESLVTRLLPELENALSDEPYVLPTIVVQGQASSDPALGPASRAAPPPPAVLLMPAIGTAAGGMVEVREPATQAAADMLHRVGVSAGQIAISGRDPVAAEIVAELRSRGIRHALLVQVLSVKYAYASVLSARGRVRIFLIGQDGLNALDTTVSTDTVVGGRGERHQALVYRVVEQALDIASPSLFRVLGRGQSATGVGV